jgi:hypothetical protein
MMQGDEVVATILVEHGVVLDLGGALFGAVVAGEVDGARLLLRYGANVNTAGLGYGCVVLIEAVKRANKAMAQVLLDGGAIIEATDENGATAIHYAVHGMLSKRPGVLREAVPWNREGTVRLLLEIGVPVTSPLDGEMPIFHLACASGFEGVALLLLNKSCFPDEYSRAYIPQDSLKPEDVDFAKRKHRRPTIGCTPLRFAVEGWHAGVLTHLLAHDAKFPYPVAYWDRTPLH